MTNPGITGVRDRLLAGDRAASADPGQVARAVRETSSTQGDRDLIALARDARAELLGAGPVLQPLLDDPLVTDVLVNADQGVWTDRGDGLRRVPAAGLGDTRALATRLAAVAGQRLDDAAPVAEGRLPDGTRLHAVLAPLSAEGALISLRTVRRQAFRLPELVAGGFLDDRAAQILAQLVRVRANVLVSGATGSGKTTLLASMLSIVPADERIVCIEEAAELAPDHPHVVHLQVRRPNVQGVGGIGLDYLVRTAMRMRPDRLVLGECRGAEVREVLGALNTGHDGGWATVHANAATDVPARLAALGSLAGLSPAAVAVQALSAVDAVVHLRRTEGRRHVDQIAVLEPDGDGGMRCEVAMGGDGHGGWWWGPGWPALAERLDSAR
ncbi:TadA family conjugal transfer-associated ATPase [Occultella glacieicola]|uniref:TadA family conjugal transfer-associated ATPase n=1 Tax=Occultella glacieicola TaxID=2518684 RepID=A0ABY2DY73_9MICO|nr:TadA family conjugal transfer-associated ATPase [Occultella glacieicola]TDE89250.1 TadA family conjugal transfer-associated ATPase [Occultella glacieicola]